MAHPLNVQVDQVAIMSFRDTADRDYVHARLAYQSRLVQQFLWSSLHCLEKYVKCVLVLNRISAKSLGHTIMPGLNRLNADGKFEIPLSNAVTKFIERLEDGAKYRYYEYSYDIHDWDVLRLDEAVWEIRRYCQAMESHSGYTDSSLEENLARIRSAFSNQEKGTCIYGGWLERVISDKKHPARKPLIWNNLRFGTSKRRVVKMRSYWEAGNAPLFNYPEALDEIATLIDFPRGVESAWRNYLHASRNHEL